MVTVKSVHSRESERGQFMSLELTGDAELVQSQNTGRFYATIRRCFISSTFDEETAKGLIGTAYAEKDISIEIYVRDNYNLTLSYKKKENENGTSTFIGKFVIENNRYKKEFNIEGRNCNL